MQIKKEFPPIYDSLLKAGMQPSDKTVYTYGDTIYNPGGHEIPMDLKIHEETHGEQQGNDPDKWWDRYLQDPYFRIQEETVAYGRQYAYACKHIIKDRNKQVQFLMMIADVLSGPIYGNMIGKNAAVRMIKEKSNQ